MNWLTVYFLVSYVFGAFFTLVRFKDNFQEKGFLPFILSPLLFPVYLFILIVHELFFKGNKE